jgi:hypothetical protein
MLMRRESYASGSSICISSTPGKMNTKQLTLLSKICHTKHQNLQFAGGFDADTIQAFEKLKKVGLGTDN